MYEKLPYYQIKNTNKNRIHCRVFQFLPIVSSKGEFIWGVCLKEGVFIKKISVQRVVFFRTITDFTIVVLNKDTYRSIYSGLHTFFYL